MTVVEDHTLAHGVGSAGQLDFSDWYKTEHPRVVAALSVASREPDVARDATDEAFTRALARWSEVRAMYCPGAWVYRVGLNVLRRSLRRRAMEERHLRGQYCSNPVLPEVCGTWPAVAALPQRQRTAIVLRYIHDLPEADIASTMGIHRGTVSSTLVAARKRLAEVLEVVEQDVQGEPRVSAA
jgi:RNA polymerase sigma-70 factor (ECF subfamily)